MIDRRWERVHRNGWRSVVVQNHDDSFIAFAELTSGTRPTPALQHSGLDAGQRAADDKVPAHECGCAPWREVHLPHDLHAVKRTKPN